MTALRPYQQQAIDSARAAVQAGHRRVLVVSPTGTGKTRLGAAMADSCIERGGTVEWYAPRRELVTQAQAVTRAEVTTIQAALRRPRRAATLRVLDEAHHQVGPDWARIDDGKSLVIGLTATPVEGLGSAFDVIVPVISIRAATEQGYLVPCEVIAPEQELRAGQLAQHPWAAYRAYCDGAKAILFAGSVEDAEKHAADFRNAGIPAECVHGESKDRDGIIERYRTGETRVLTSVNVITEGFDAPDTYACILASKCGAVHTYLQRVGRALRPAPGKTGALVIDLCGSSIAHGHPSLDRTYHLDGVAIRQAGHADGVSFCRVCGAILNPPEPCGECGASRDRSYPVVVDKPLRVYAYQRLAGDAPDVRVQRLAKWLHEAADRGHKAGAALYKFKACYRTWPTAAEKAKAAAIVAARRRTNAA